MLRQSHMAIKSMIHQVVSFVDICKNQSLFVRHQHISFSNVMPLNYLPVIQYLKAVRPVRKDVPVEAVGRLPLDGTLRGPQGAFPVGIAELKDIWVLFHSRGGG